MAKNDEYIDEAYQTLLKLSADEKKRLEYEAREKALHDFNSQISSAIKHGEEIGQKRGEEIGQKRGIQLAREVFKLNSSGVSVEDIALQCGITTDQVKEILQ